MEIIIIKEKEFDEIIYTDILNLVYEISITSYERCTHNYGAQHGHSCLNPFSYNLALDKTIETVKKEYNIGKSLDYIYKENFMKES